MFAQLLNSKADTSIVDIYADRLVFHSKSFELQLKVSGLNLPVYLAHELKGRREISFKDPEFPKAFALLYKERAKTMGFVWKAISP
jgi:hypothetical protein